MEIRSQIQNYIFWQPKIKYYGNTDTNSYYYLKWKYTNSPCKASLQ